MPESGCGTYLLKALPPGASAKAYFSGYTLSSKQALELRAIAQQDACRYAYNAAASFLAALAGLQGHRAAWAVTQLYYTVFYVGRAALCRAGLVIFHAPKPSGNGNTQYELRAIAGGVPMISSRTPSTHKLTAKRFRELGYPNFMSGLEIESQDPLEWLMNQREYWQYRAARFPDPEMPSALEQINTSKIQRLLEEYFIDKKGIYLSDPAHALLAIPFRLLLWTLDEAPLLIPGVTSDEDLSYLRAHCRVGKQTLTRVRGLLQ